MRLALIVVVSLGVIAFGIIRVNDARQDNVAKNQSQNSFDKSKYSIDDPNSIWVVVNKKRPLPTGYAPGNLIDGLRPEANGALKKLLAEAIRSGHQLKNLSAYRSFSDQQATYNSVVAGFGQEEADRQSARAGYSEHQTGLAVDLGNGNCDLEACFGNTPAGKWLAENAHKYGFILRYQQGKGSITGYEYEPWHLRYVGEELSNEMNRTGQTLEEFFGLPAAATY